MTTRVLLVDDSATARRILRTHLERDARFQVVGEACDGREGLEMKARVQPDVVSLDLHIGTSLRTAAGHMAERDIGCMPVLDGEGELVAILTRADIVATLAADSDDEDLFA